jgi:glycosyltransferase involved in cell wall biosynthesis
MHILFVHPNFPAQFGHVASHLARHHGHRCTFVSERPPGNSDGVERIQYRNLGGATNSTHYCSRTFENAVWHTHGVFQALKARPDIRPDLIVGHSGFGSTLFLRELYPGRPIVNYFEYFYRTVGSDMDFRPDFPTQELDRLRARARNAMILLDLDNCDFGYCPTQWQRARFPVEYQSKLRVIFDGIDTEVWKPQPGLPRRVGNYTIPDGVKVVTYATRGMEAMRGFDVFMKSANLLCKRRPDVLFLIAGRDRVAYGNDTRVTGGKTFKAWVLSQGDYDLRRFVFLDLLSPLELAKLFCLTDLHVYLTVPFVVSWSLLNALACGTTVLASDTDPVREVITDGHNGLLTDFFDHEAMADRVEQVLDRPDDYRHLGAAAVERIRQQYSLDVCLPQMLRLYEEACNTGWDFAPAAPAPAAART